MCKHSIILKINHLYNNFIIVKLQFNLAIVPIQFSIVQQIQPGCFAAQVEQLLMLNSCIIVEILASSVTAVLV